MAKVTLDLSAIDALSSRAVVGGVRSVLGAAERILKGDILNRPGTGRQYGKHRASSPGQPPAPDVGNLKANTNADPSLSMDGDEVVGQLTADAAYAEALSKGTERMAARPFFDLLITDHSAALERAFVEGAKQ